MKRTKSATIFARVTEEELEAIEKICDRTDRTLSSVVRLMILSSFKHCDPTYYKKLVKKHGITYDPDELLRTQMVPSATT